MKNKTTFFKRHQFAYPLFFLSVILSTVIVSAQPTSQTFNSSGTYTIPAGYSANVTIEAWGAGGGGGSSTNGAKGGGGGGAYASSTTTLTAGSYTVTVGTGGAIAIAGGNSSFTTIVIAEGGGSTTGTTGGAGGTTAGSTGTILVAGVAGSGTSGNNGGAGGAGGAGGVANNGSGSNGTSPGGGGGGKAGPGTGGTSGIGANGRVIVTINSVLPVNFGTIAAYEKHSGIQIDWKVYWEENVSHYDIERSLNGRDFITKGTVTARNIRATSNYSWFDENPVQGISFYRLKSVDLDNKFMYSSIVKINLNKAIKGISVYPNPVNGGQISIQSSDLEKGNYYARIMNSSGQLVYKTYFDHNGGAVTKVLQFPVNLHPGLYVLQLDNTGSKIMSKSFILQ